MFVVLDEQDRCALLHGDSKDLGAIVPESYVDSIVCDPPAGIGFMGKAWDGDKGGRKQWIAWLVETMAASYAALKPGGHALVWAIPRTSHWTMTALEELGFEIRDVVTHLFGTGFPKSANISKAIDRAAGAKREVLGENPNHRSDSGVSYEGVYAGANTGAATITGPATEDAKKWDGFGTALKPAAEFWILCRKPLVEKTIAKNVLKWGTGALNIDGCRIGENPGYKYDADKNGSTFHGDQGERSAYSSDKAGKATIESTKGRWPANVTLDEHAAAVLDEQSGVLTSGAASGKRSTDKFRSTYSSFKGSAEEAPIKASKGGASRFYYVAKPSRKEKDAGLDHIAAKLGGEATGRKEGSKGTENPRAGAGRTGGARNSHPTVKSIALMSWLIRLITPPGGTVLDPFAGSGTTGVAALGEGFKFIGCEMSDEYIEIVKGRLLHALKC